MFVPNATVRVYWNIMKILFTGGVTGGHFYPIIAVAEAIRDIAKERKLLDPQLFYAAPTPFNEKMLFENDIAFRGIAAGKVRKGGGRIANFFDLFKTGWGVVKSVITIFFLYPDVIFGKGGYGSFPTLLAGKLFHIPVVIHESDAVPGKVNVWAGKFARRVAVSYPAAASYFPKEKTAHTGNPIRKALLHPAAEGATEFLGLELGVPTILIIGGSQGAQAINEVILGALPELLSRYQIIHQTGEANLVSVEKTAVVILKDHPRKSRYHAFPYLNDLALRMSAGTASLAVTRAGSAIFEFAVWKLPAIVVPIPTAISHDQTQNAFSYAKSGAAVVIEQNNLTPHLLTSEIDRIIENKPLYESMREAAGRFADIGAARTIATELIDIALSHEPR